jgi:hypothetical protein
MVLRSRRAAVLLGLSLFLIMNQGLAQEKAAKQQDLPATSLGKAFQELQRELDALRAAGKIKEADSLQLQAQRVLSGILSQHRQVQSRAKQQQDPAAHQLEETRRLVEQIREEIGPETAEPLAKRLAVIEQSLKDGKTLIEREGQGGDGEPEVHVIRINAGVALPEEFATGRDHRTVGYAEVVLEYSDRPVILVLYSGRPTLWNIKRKKECTLHAILRFDVKQELMGAGDCLVLESNRLGLALQQETGLATITEQISMTYDGSPLTIGPSNHVWLAQSLLPSIASVTMQATEMLTSHRLAPFMDLRFTAAHYVDADGFGPRDTRISVGQFTVAGPIANSLEPVPERLHTPMVVSGGEKPFRFALDASGRLIMSEREGATFSPVPVAASVQRLGALFSSFCLDTKRDRLVLARRVSGTLCTYDIAKGKWSQLGDSKSSILSIVYQAKDDMFLAITLQPNGPQSVSDPLGLVHIDTDGKIAFSRQLRFQAVDGTTQVMNAAMRSIVPSSGVHLAIVDDDKLAVIYHGTMARATDKPLKLLDSKTGDVIYEGPIRVHQGEAPALVLARRPPPKAPASGLLALIDDLFAKAEEVKAKLADEKPERAKKFAARLTELRGVTGGRPARREGEQQYTVSVPPLDDHSVEVIFADTSGPAILYLISSRGNTKVGPVKWQVRVGVGTELKQIILTSAQDELANPPAGVTVRRGATNRPPPNRLLPPNLFLPPNRPAPTMSASESAIRFMLPVVNGRPAGLTIGPENGQWRAEMVKRQLDRLIENAGIELESPQLVELMEHRFFAVTRVGPVRPFPVARQAAKQEPSLWAEFTIHGPIIGTERPITLKPKDQILATTRERVLVLEIGRGFDVTFASIDVATDKRTTLVVPPIRHSARDCRSAFDASRNRLYLAGREGIHVYDLATLKWRSFAGRRVGSMFALAAYNQAADMFYQSDTFGGRGGSAKRYNFRGAVLDSVPLKLKTQTPFGNQGLQSVGFGHFLGELQHLSTRGTIRVTDLRNGDLVYEGPLLRHVERMALSTRELSSIYKGLTNEGNEADELIWQMTAAHNGAVRFLDKELHVPTDTQVDIDPLVEQLNSDLFAERNSAFKELQQLGSEIEPLIRRALKAKHSTETKARLERLIKTWESAAPQNGAERQHVHAVTVLHRIGSSPAIALLREITSGRGSPVARRAAREALQALGK